MKSIGVSRAALLSLLLMITAAWQDRAAAAALDASVQAHIRASTFEVVQQKPAEAGVTYDRPPPFELLPYQERTDKYRSIGTAFALGGNHYVTAAHVMSLGMGSQFGPPALRDAAGNVYVIDKVIKYSQREDFVEFTLREEPKGVQALEAGTPPQLNDTVFAVGNALGEGVVIRDGVYTSDTPEEQEGQWKWLRFSAAASPGNSGGPLVNQSGQVIGVVLRKSESENLNYALSIAQVAAAKEGEGKFETRSAIRLGNIADSSETFEVHEGIALPKPLADFYTALHAVLLNNARKSTQLLLTHNKDKLFPNGVGSAQILASAPESPLPVLMERGQDGQWGVPRQQANSSDLGDNGVLELANGAFRLRLPDDVKLATIEGDSKQLMDLFLKGERLQRQVGSDSVRVTSLGKAIQHSTYTDVWGRTWRIDIWAVPFDDLYLTLCSLPTPEGEVGFVTPISSSLSDIVQEAEKPLFDSAYFTMQGTLAQWQDYLTQKEQLKLFESLGLSVDPAQYVRVHSKRFQLDLTPAQIELAKDARLVVDTSFFSADGKVVWDVSSLGVQAPQQKNNWIHVHRIPKPAPTLAQGFQDNWSKVQAAQYPYNAMVIHSDGETRIVGMVDSVSGAVDAAQFRYDLTAQLEGDQTQDTMAPKLDQLRKVFKLLEK